MTTKNTPLSLREIQLVELDILKRLVQIFEIHNIHYILCGGTMLGAVRHQGFIPWDDDIDILVPRDDYERLKSLARRENEKSQSLRLRLPGDKGNAYPFIKATDINYIVKDTKRDERYPAYIWVDVFPMDHFPDNEAEHRKCIKHITALVQILSSNTITKEYLKTRGYYSNPLKMAKLFVSRVLYLILGGNSAISGRIDNYARKMDKHNKQSYHVGDGAWPNGMKDYFPLEAVVPVMKHTFEDSEFNIPVNYDKYLTLFYGDYMTIPPAGERQDHHIEVYRVEGST